MTPSPPLEALPLKKTDQTPPQKTLSPSQAFLLNMRPAEPAFGHAIEAVMQIPYGQHVLVAHLSSGEPHSELLVHLW
jgi:hypothetical protein